MGADGKMKARGMRVSGLLRDGTGEAALGADIWVSEGK